MANNIIPHTILNHIYRIRRRSAERRWSFIHLLIYFHIYSCVQWYWWQLVVLECLELVYNLRSIIFFLFLFSPIYLFYSFHYINGVFENSQFFQKYQQYTVITVLL